MQDLNAMPAPPPAAAQAISIGTLKRLTIRCISEVGWLDTPTLLADITAAGGMNASQYDVPWPPFAQLHAENAAGSSALLEAQTPDGRLHRVLFDTGWNPAWMERRFAEEGVDRLLADGAIDCLVISHEHFSICSITPAAPLSGVSASMRSMADCISPHSRIGMRRRMG